MYHIRAVTLINLFYKIIKSRVAIETSLYVTTIFTITKGVVQMILYVLYSLLYIIYTIVWLILIPHFISNLFIEREFIGRGQAYI